MPTADALDRLPYLSAVVAELLRRHPPTVQLVNRRLSAPAAWPGVGVVPRGTFVGWNMYLAHTDPKTWGPTARDFDPGRWGNTAEGVQARMRRETARGAFLPFASHQRTCPGQTFAMVEAKVVLFEAVRRMRWVVAPDYRLNWTVLGLLATMGASAHVEGSCCLGNILGPAEIACHFHRTVGIRATR